MGKPRAFVRGVRYYLCYPGTLLFDSLRQMMAGHHISFTKI